MLNILNMSSSHAIKNRENTYMHDTDDVRSGRSGGQPDRSTILRWGGYLPPIISTGMRALFQEYVAKLLDVLSPSTDGKKKKLHKSAVEKLQTFLNTFDLRNVTDDTELQAEVAKLKLIMEGVDTDKIKESDNLKADLVTKFAEVNTDMMNLVAVKGRKIR